MRKEILIAIIIGLVMGLFITYGYYHSQQTTEVNQITNIENGKPSDSSSTDQNTGKVNIFIRYYDCIVGYYFFIIC